MSKATQTPTDRTDQEQIREIGHDEYDPIGTLALIGLYFLVLASMWLFMYFVEFVGHGPTVVGTVLMGGML